MATTEYSHSVAQIQGTEGFSGETLSPGRWGISTGSIGAMVLDGFLAVLAWVLAYVLRYHSGISAHFSRVWHERALFGISSTHAAVFLVLFALCLVLVSKQMGLYRPPRFRSILNEQRSSVNACLTTGLLTTGAIYLFHANQMPRSLVLLALVLLAFLLSLHRILVRYAALRAIKAGLGLRRVLIVGEGPEADALASHLGNLRALGFSVEGFNALPDFSDHVTASLHMTRIFDRARAEFVDEIFLVAPRRDGLVEEMLRRSRENNFDLRVVPDLYDGLAWRRPMEYVGHFPTFPLHRGHIPEFSLFLKRSMDVLISLVGLTVLAIPMLILALLIKLDSKGPIFYRAERVGYKGRRIKCTKFRTMVQDADRKLAEIMHLNEREGILFKVKDDPRITRLGRFLRKYSIDEVPQLFDVLRGEMSIVGPRPPIASEVREYQLHHLRRLDVTPGITGLWQVQARQDPSFDSYISLDVAYIENWSLWMDLKIIARTIGVVLAGTGS